MAAQYSLTVQNRGLKHHSSFIHLSTAWLLWHSLQVDMMICIWPFESLDSDVFIEKDWMWHKA